MIDLTELPIWWAFAGAFVGVIVAKILAFIITRLAGLIKRKVETAKAVYKPRKRRLICDVCKSTITSTPVESVVTTAGTQIVYRCQQCGSMVGVPPP